MKLMAQERLHEPQRLDEFQFRWLEDREGGIKFFDDQPSKIKLVLETEKLRL